MLLENFKDTLFICIKLLEESKIDYSVIGGIAVNIWGFPRSTKEKADLKYIKRLAREWDTIDLFEN